MDERMVPMNNASRVLFTGADAGMATKSQEWVIIRTPETRREKRRATGAVDWIRPTKLLGLDKCLS